MGGAAQVVLLPPSLNVLVVAVVTRLEATRTFFYTQVSPQTKKPKGI